MDFAKGFIARCEERHGIAAVEHILDAAHALMEQGVFRYRRPPRLSSEKEREGIRERLEYEERTFNDLWRTLPRSKEGGQVGEADSAAERKKSLNLPEENLLYFLEKNSLDPGAMAAGDPQDRSHHRPVFLPAAADPGDERRLRHLRALHHHEHTLRPGQDQRRRYAGDPA